ncbi:MAG: hypothetical protein ACYS8K_08610, partial [Planctomycetota bacterium]
MLPRVEITGKIEQFYMEERSVPYLTFMTVFNDLLEDPANVTPKAPAEEQRDKFRAACMCVNVGLVDTEGRAEERFREFRQRVFPVWEAKLPPDELTECRELMSGELRKSRQREAHREQEAAAREAAEKERKLLARLGLDELEEEQAPAVPAPAEAAPAQPPPSAEAPRLEGLDALTSAIREGRLQPQYAPRSEAGVFARYLLADREVQVTLAEAEGSHYTVLKADVGRSDVPDAALLTDVLAAEMGYVRMAEFAYMRR